MKSLNQIEPNKWLGSLRAQVFSVLLNFYLIFSFFNRIQDVNKIKIILRMTENEEKKQKNKRNWTLMKNKHYVLKLLFINNRPLSALFELAKKTIFIFIDTFYSNKLELHNQLLIDLRLISQAIVQDQQSLKA